MYELDTRLGYVDEDPLFIAAMFLDPNFKLDFLDEESAEKAKCLIKELIDDGEKQSAVEVLATALETGAESDEYGCLRKRQAASAAITPKKASHQKLRTIYAAPFPVEKSAVH